MSEKRPLPPVRLPVDAIVYLAGDLQKFPAKVRIVAWDPRNSDWAMVIPETGDGVGSVQAAKLLFATDAEACRFLSDRALELGHLSILDAMTLRERATRNAKEETP